ncbi:T7N9.1 [Arabidopsis thaliana]|uniref:T7N9.1 n=1 Tax=Arabidopsis thaliana TaxID=3702 RepID=Q9LFZ0_ARATH|nr:T7N9.1 [Arabidopsis thaliana]
MTNEWDQSQEVDEISLVYTKSEMSVAHVCFCLTILILLQLLSFMLFLFCPVFFLIAMSLSSVSSSHLLSVLLLIFCPVYETFYLLHWI